MNITRNICPNCTHEQLTTVCHQCNSTRVPLPEQGEPAVCPRCYVRTFATRQEQKHAAACLANVAAMQAGKEVTKLCVCPLNSI